MLHVIFPFYFRGGLKSIINILFENLSTLRLIRLITLERQEHSFDYTPCLDRC